MARKVFYSFQYIPDNWRVSTVRQIGAIEGNKAATDNDWEKITDGKDEKIEKWINDQMVGKSCMLLLIGKDTAKRKWIDYEIKQAWAKKKGIVGIHIHNLKNSNGDKSTRGQNPFSHFTIGKDSNKKELDTIIKTYNPPYTDSKLVYNHIKENVVDWIEEAIEIRGRH